MHCPLSPAGLLSAGPHTLAAALLPPARPVWHMAAWAVVSHLLKSVPTDMGASVTPCCGMQGILPTEWGLNGIFPRLTSLSVSYNPPLSGLLPATWGSDNSSFQFLRVFEANNCNLTGSLPAQWAVELPSLTDINISSNALTGFCGGPNCSKQPLICSAELL